MPAAAPSAQPLAGRPLGEILVRTGRLAPEALEAALAAQQGEHAGLRLGEVLVRTRALVEADVLRALALQLELPYLERVDAAAPPDLVRLVPLHFAKSARVLPLGPAPGGGVRAAVADPLDTAALDQLAGLLGARVDPELASAQAVLDAINAVYDRAADEHDRIMAGIEGDDLDTVAHELEEPADLLDADDEAPIIRLVNSLLFRAVKERASDIHVNPEERDLTVRYRIDGVLREVIRPPKRIQAALASRIKIMGGLNIAEKRLPQDGRIRIKLAGKDVDIRLSTVPTAHGERIVMRLLDKSNVILDLAQIGFEPWQLEIMDGLITRSHGIVLVTGPTGSGKTTTLYAALSKINSPDLNILTIEDPVEIQLAGVGQVQVNPKIELTFAAGLRSFLRQDPDVILVGEIRDLETAEIAIQASLTGHLVFSTLHTNDAAGAITRLVDMGVQPFLVASSLVGVLAQRLVRVLCPACKVPYRAHRGGAGAGQHHAAHPGPGREPGGALPVAGLPRLPEHRLPGPHRHLRADARRRRRAAAGAAERRLGQHQEGGRPARDAHAPRARRLQGGPRHHHRRRGAVGDGGGHPLTRSRSFGPTGKCVISLSPGRGEGRGEGSAYASLRVQGARRARPERGRAQGGRVAQGAARRAASRRPLPHRGAGPARGRGRRAARGVGAPLGGRAHRHRRRGGRHPPAGGAGGRRGPAGGGAGRAGGPGGPRAHEAGGLRRAPARQRGQPAGRRAGHPPARLLHALREHDPRRRVLRRARAGAGAPGRLHRVRRRACAGR